MAHFFHFLLLVSVINGSEPHPLLEAATFPGFTLLELAQAGMMARTLDRARDGTGVGNKPDTYLFPYLFPGSTFPSFSIGDMEFPPSSIPSGIARPITPADVAAVLTSHRPWVKEELVKPIKEIMKRPSPQHLSSSSAGGRKYWIISSSIPGKLIITFQTPENVSKELIEHLSKSLDQFQGPSLGSEVGSLQKGDAIPESSQPNTFLSPAVTSPKLSPKKDAEKLLIPTILPISIGESKPVKVKPSPKPRPEYGIQQQKEETPGAPLLSPFPSIQKWSSSFTSLIHHLFHERLTASKSGRLGRTNVNCGNEERSDLDPEEEALCPLTQLTSSSSYCAGVCERGGYSGGSCLKYRNPGQSSCLCHLDESGRFGFLLKREKTAKSKQSGPEVGQGRDGGEEEGGVDGGGCENGCRSLGAYTGFCGGAGRGHCFCAVPWANYDHEGLD